MRLANDANCFALSEATDGAGAGRRVVFGVILGTGCGGGVVVDGRLLEGANGIAGEWGHTPLPWPTAEELAVAPCWCGRRGCLETWISGPGLGADFARASGRGGERRGGDRRRHGPATRRPRAAFDRYVDRLARGLAVVVRHPRSRT